MSFDFNHKSISHITGTLLQMLLFESFHVSLEKNKMFFILGPLVGLTAECVDELAYLANVVEAVAGGVINILGSIFSSRYSFQKGLKNITIDFALTSVQLIVDTILFVFVSSISALLTLQSPSYCINKTKNSLDYFNRRITQFLWYSCQYA